MLCLARTAPRQMGLTRAELVQAQGLIHRPASRPFPENTRSAGNGQEQALHESFFTLEGSWQGSSASMSHVGSGDAATGRGEGAAAPPGAHPRHPRAGGANSRLFPWSFLPRA